MHGQVAFVLMVNRYYDKPSFENSVDLRSAGSFLSLSMYHSQA